ncbi:MAG: hypothetical protein MZU79_06935 [Anaerotruncus sp.]|nr:hypothetical protein [Anaerotruncus sp.]
MPPERRPQTPGESGAGGPGPQKDIGNEERPYVFRGIEPDFKSGAKAWLRPSCAQRDLNAPSTFNRMGDAPIRARKGTRLPSAGYPPKTPATGARSGKSALIVVENQPYLTDTRVKAEAASLREAGWRVHVICPRISGKAKGKGRPRLSRPYARWDRYPFLPDGLRRPWQGRLPSGVSCFPLLRIARLSLRVYRRDRFSVIHLCNPPDFLFLVRGLL